MPETMKVGMYYNNKDVRLEEMPVPKVGDKDVLIKVKSSGICGSDVMEWYRIKKAPLVLGHELAGDVVEVGKDVRKYKVGDRVFATHHVPCNECPTCYSGNETACEVFHKENNFTPGGFSQYLRVTGRSVDKGMMKLPDEVSYDKGTFIEPLGTVVRGLRTAKLKPGDSMVVLGSGLIGLMHIKLAKALGAGNIIATDVHEYRLDAAEDFGAEYTLFADEVNPDSIKHMNNGNLADKVIVCTGAKPAADMALELVGKGGVVMYFAVPKPEERLTVDINTFWRDSKRILVSYGAAPIDNFEAMELIRAGNVKVDDMITHKLGLEEIAKGFRLASEGENNCLKVIIEPNKT